MYAPGKPGAYIFGKRRAEKKEGKNGRDAGQNSRIRPEVRPSAEDTKPGPLRTERLLQQHRLELAAFHSRLYRLAEKGKVALEREGLLMRRVLPEGDEVYVFAL